MNTANGLSRQYSAVGDGARRYASSSCLSGTDRPFGRTHAEGAGGGLVVRVAPEALEEPDMTKAVLKTLQPVVNDSRLAAVRFNVPRARLSDNTAHALLRVIRELVVNAIRHGNASAIKVAGTIDNGKLLCSVTDDGCGFDPDAAPGVLQGHFGLQGIQERIEELGGEFTIRSSCGKGTKATINIPIPHES